MTVIQMKEDVANCLVKLSSLHYCEPCILQGCLPDELPFTLPSLPTVQVIASIDRGRRNYDILQSVSVSGEYVRAFYLNRLRLSNWLVHKPTEDTHPENYGLRAVHRKLSPLRLFHPLYALTLTLTFVTAAADTSTFWIVVEDTGTSYGLFDRSLSESINWSPIPLLSPPPDSKCASGSRGGSGSDFNELRILDSAPSVETTFSTYQQQIDDIGWTAQDRSVEADIAFGSWQSIDGKQQYRSTFFMDGIGY